MCHVQTPEGGAHGREGPTDIASPTVLTIAPLHIAATENASATTLEASQQCRRRVGWHTETMLELGPQDLVRCVAKGQAWCALARTRMAMLRATQKAISLGHGKDRRALRGCGWALQYSHTINQSAMPSRIVAPIPTCMTQPNERVVLPRAMTARLCSLKLSSDM